MVLRLLADDEGIDRLALTPALDRDGRRDRVGAERQPADRVDLEVADQVEHDLADQRAALGRERRELAVEEELGAFAGTEDEIAESERTLLQDFEETQALFFE